MNDLMRRLYLIQSECGSMETKQQEDIANMDEFTKTKKDIHRRVRAIREKIEERDKLLEKSAGTKFTVEVSAQIRTMLREVKDQAARLAAIQRQQAKKTRKTAADEELVQRRNDIVDLVFKHIEECEALEKRRYADKVGADRFSLFSNITRTNGNPDGAAGGGGGGGGGGAPATATALPDIDTQEGLMMLDRKNQLIDQHLQEVGEGVQVLKQQALAMQQEVKTQNIMIDDVTGKVDDTLAHVVKVNTKLKKTLASVRKGDRFVVDFILLCVLLGIIGYIYSLVSG